MKILAAGLNFKWSCVSRCMNFQEREVNKLRKNNKVRVIGKYVAENYND